MSNEVFGETENQQFMEDDFESLANKREAEITGVEVEDTEGDIKDEASGTLPGKITQPFDPLKIRVAPRPLTVDLLVKRIKEDEIDLAPDFQRKAGIWNTRTQSRLIESMLIRIPLPAFYFDATNDEKWLVIDGLQRLTALKQFIVDGKLILRNLEFLKDYNSYRFKQLPRNLQRRIEETQVTAYLIEKGTPEEVKFNIFKRINTGGVPLSPQEIRHALNQGKASKLLLELSLSEEFKEATDGSIRDDRMADRECILRALAFKISGYQEYKEDLDTFLNERMAQINKMSDPEVDRLSQDFRHAMRNAAKIFGTDAFRKPQKNKRMPISKPLFEIWTVNLDKLSEGEMTKLVEKKDIVKKKFSELFSNGVNQTEFEHAITVATGVTKQVKFRFSKIQSLIQEVLND
jgi:uncharacterized protein with ParB-like and HNH nuclease domain